jgi:hypothetical protein
MSLEQQWGLALGWHSADRRDPNWSRRTPAEVEAIFAKVGLAGDFWRL